MATCAACGSMLPGGARFCPMCAVPVGRPATEERKLATILFVDLVGSTALASGEDPERVRALLDRFYKAMAAQAEATGGTVGNLRGTRCWPPSAPEERVRTTPSGPSTRRSR
jgi:hypothetical protein